MTKYVFPEPLTAEAPNTETGGLHFDTDARGRVTGAVIKLGDHDCAILGINNGDVRIAEISTNRLSAREAVFLGWALTTLAAHQEVRW